MDDQKVCNRRGYTYSIYVPCAERNWNAGGRYFTTTGLIVVEELTEEIILTTVNGLLDSERFFDIFKLCK